LKEDNKHGDLNKYKGYWKGSSCRGIKGKENFDRQGIVAKSNERGGMGRENERERGGTKKRKSGAVGGEERHRAQIGAWVEKRDNRTGRQRPDKFRSQSPS